METPNKPMRIFKMVEENKPQVDPDDAPKLTEDWFEKTSLKKGDEVIRIGKRFSDNIDHGILINKTDNQLRKLKGYR